MMWGTSLRAALSGGGWLTSKWQYADLAWDRQRLQGMGCPSQGCRGWQCRSTVSCASKGQWSEPRRCWLTTTLLSIDRAAAFTKMWSGRVGWVRLVAAKVGRAASSPAICPVQI